MIEHLKLHHPKKIKDDDKNDNACKRQCFTEESANVTVVVITNKQQMMINEEINNKTKFDNQHICLTSKFNHCVHCELTQLQLCN